MWVCAVAGRILYRTCQIQAGYFYKAHRWKFIYRRVPRLGLYSFWIIQSGKCVNLQDYGSGLFTMPVFRLFKIDYIYENYLRHLSESNVKIGIIDFSRRIFKTIRESVGENSHIINCGGNRRRRAIGIADSFQSICRHP